MSPKSKTTLPILLGFGLLGLSAWGLYKLVLVIWRIFATVNPTLGAGIIAASATVIVSVISVLVAKRIEQKTEIQKELRDRKTPVYEELVAFIFRITFAEKLGQAAVTESEMIQNMAKFTEKLVIWGSDDLVQAWYKFRMEAVDGKTEGVNAAFSVEEILYAIRQDLGHANKNLGKGKLLGLFINDIRDYV